MPFDANLVLIDGTVTLTAATAASHVPATSTTRETTNTGAAVIDLKETGVKGLAAVLVLPTAGNGTTDYLVGYIQSSDTEDMTGTTTGILHHGTFGIAAATTGRILGNEAPAIVVLRFTTTKRYVRANLTPVAGNGTGSFGLVQVLLSPYPFDIL